MSSSGSGGSNLTLGDLIYRLGFANEQEFLDEMERLMNRAGDEAAEGAADAGQRAGNNFGQEFRDSALGPLANLTLGSFLGEALANAFQGAIDAARQLAEESRKEFGRYEQGLVQMQLAGETNIGLMEERLTSLSDKFKVFSETDFSLATGEMIKAGHTTQQALELAAGGARLAKSEIDPLKGEFLDLGEQTKNVSDILAGFGISIEDTTKAVDVITGAVDLLAKGSQDSKLSLAELIPAVTENASTFRTAKISLSELTATLAIAKQNGLEMAQTSNIIGSAITTLIDPPKELKEMFDRLGISIIKQDGTYRSYTEVLRNLKAVMDQGGKGAQALGAMFDSAQVKIIYSMAQSADQIEQFDDSLQHASGTAENLGNTLEHTVIGEMKVLEASAANARRELGEKLAPLMHSAEVMGFNAMNAALTKTIEYWEHWRLIISGTNSELQRMQKDADLALAKSMGSQQLATQFSQAFEQITKIRAELKEAEEDQKMIELRSRGSGARNAELDVRIAQLRNQEAQLEITLAQIRAESKKLQQETTKPPKAIPPTAPPKLDDGSGGKGLAYTNAQVQALIPRARELVSILNSAKSAEGIAAANVAIDQFKAKSEAAKAAIEAANKEWQLQNRGVREGSSALEVLKLRYENGLVTLTQFRAGLEAIRTQNEKVASSTKEGSDKWVKAQQAIKDVNDELKKLESSTQKTALRDYEIRVDALRERFQKGKITFEEYGAGITKLEGELQKLLSGTPQDSDFARGVSALLKKLDDGKQEISDFVSANENAVLELIRQADSFDEAWSRNNPKWKMTLTELQTNLGQISDERIPDVISAIEGLMGDGYLVDTDGSITKWIGTLKSRAEDAKTAVDELAAAQRELTQRETRAAMQDYLQGLNLSDVNGEIALVEEQITNTNNALSKLNLLDWLDQLKARRDELIDLDFAKSKVQENLLSAPGFFLGVDPKTLASFTEDELTELEDLRGSMSLNEWIRYLEDFQSGFSKVSDKYQDIQKMIDAAWDLSIRKGQVAQDLLPPPPPLINPELIAQFDEEQQAELKRLQATLSPREWIQYLQDWQSGFAETSKEYQEIQRLIDDAWEQQIARGKLEESLLGNPKPFINPELIAQFDEAQKAELEALKKSLPLNEWIRYLEDFQSGFDQASQEYQNIQKMIDEARDLSVNRGKADEAMLSAPKPFIDPELITQFEEEQRAELKRLRETLSPDEWVKYLADWQSGFAETSKEYQEIQRLIDAAMDDLAALPPKFVRTIDSEIDRLGDGVGSAEDRIESTRQAVNALTAEFERTGDVDGYRRELLDLLTQLEDMPDAIGVVIDALDRLNKTKVDPLGDQQKQELGVAELQYQLGDIDKATFEARLNLAIEFWRARLLLEKQFLAAIKDINSQAYRDQLTKLEATQRTLTGLENKKISLKAEWEFDPEAFQSGLEGIAMDFGEALVNGIIDGNLGEALRGVLGNATDFFIGEMLKGIIGPIAQNLAGTITGALSGGGGGAGGALGGLLGGINPLAALGIAVGVGLLGSLFGEINRPQKTGREAAAGEARTARGSAPNIYYQATANVTVPVGGSLDDPSTRAAIRALATDTTVDVLKRLGLIK